MGILDRLANTRKDIFKEIKKEYFPNLKSLFFSPKWEGCTAGLTQTHF